jgi:hypothetical protein
MLANALGRRSESLPRYLLSADGHACHLPPGANQACTGLPAVGLSDAREFRGFLEARAWVLGIHPSRREPESPGGSSRNTAWGSREKNRKTPLARALALRQRQGAEANNRADKILTVATDSILLILSIYVKSSQPAQIQMDCGTDGCFVLSAQSAVKSPWLRE